MTHGARTGAVAAVTEEQKLAAHEVDVVLGEAVLQHEATTYLLRTDGAKVALPEPLFRLLRQAANLLAAGNRVVLTPVNPQLSTQEAADLLNVSRPYLVKLLDDGTIQHSKTGRHRRVNVDDVVAYMNKRDEARREHLRDLIRKGEEMGLYDEEEYPARSTR